MVSIMTLVLEYVDIWRANHRSTRGYRMVDDEGDRDELLKAAGRSAMGDPP